MPAPIDTEPRTQQAPAPDPLPAWEETAAEAGRSDRNYWADRYDD